MKKLPVIFLFLFVVAIPLAVYGTSGAKPKGLIDEVKELREDLHVLKAENEELKRKITGESLQTALLAANLMAIPSSGTLKTAVFDEIGDHTWTAPENISGNVVFILGRGGAGGGGGGGGGGVIIQKRKGSNGSAGKNGTSTTFGEIVSFPGGEGGKGGGGGFNVGTGAGGAGYGGAQNGRTRGPGGTGASSGGDGGAGGKGVGANGSRGGGGGGTEDVLKIVIVEPSREYAIHVGSGGAAGNRGNQAKGLKSSGRGSHGKAGEQGHLIILWFEGI